MLCYPAKTGKNPLLAVLQYCVTEALLLLPVVQEKTCRDSKAFYRRPPVVGSYWCVVLLQIICSIFHKPNLYATPMFDFY